MTTCHRRIAVALALAATGLASCSSQPERPEIALRDIDDVIRKPLVADGAVATVLIFITVDCPIANAYAPEIRAIADDYAARGLRFWLVHVDPDVDAGAAAAHAREYGYGAVTPILLDTTHELVREIGPRHTPEAVLVLPDRSIAYRGRIDDLYADLGKKRARATEHDLRDALDALLSGKPVAKPRTEAVGCYVPTLR